MSADEINADYCKPLTPTLSLRGERRKVRVEICGNPQRFFCAFCGLSV